MFYFSWENIDDIAVDDLKIILGKNNWIIWDIPSINKLGPEEMGDNSTFWWEGFFVFWLQFDWICPYESNLW